MPRLRSDPKTLLVTTLATLATSPILARGQTPAAPQPRDSSAVVATVEAFHTALETGDTAAVRELLAEDVVVAEGGGVESREEYLGGHLGADMAFAGAVTRDSRLVQVTMAGDVAWVASTARRAGTYREREIDSRGAELMVLGHDGRRWRIRAIHWSSR